MASSGVSFATGGSTPKASAVSITIVEGWPARLSVDVVRDRRQRIGAAGVLGHATSSSRSRRRVAGSMTTFSSTVPKLRVVA